MEELQRLSGMDGTEMLKIRLAEAPARERAAILKAQSQRLRKDTCLW
jgi:hypothetical protein